MAVLAPIDLRSAREAARAALAFACFVACLLLSFPGVEVARADAGSEQAVECRVPDRMAARAAAHAKAARVRKDMQLAASNAGEAFVPLNTMGMNYRTSMGGGELRAIAQEVAPPPARPE